MVSTYTAEILNFYNLINQLILVHCAPKQPKLVFLSLKFVHYLVDFITFLKELLFFG